MRRSNLCFSVITFLFVVLISCQSENKNQLSGDPKFQQYYIQGEQLYVAHCSNCHQKNGKGLGLLYPPLDTSDYMQNNFEDVLCLIRHGKSGELMVNGKLYNQQMPGVTALTDLEIAQIATYIYNTWSHKKGMVEVKEATSILNQCKKQ
ncbi:MAG: cytochrome c [Cyclobacteriaceae bacterium]|jgi:cytochrome c551|nr:cytochrome c [Cyclobacteriaceae bacterium]